MRYKWIHLLIGFFAISLLLASEASTTNSLSATSTAKQCALTHNENDPPCTSNQAAQSEKAISEPQLRISDALNNPDNVKLKLSTEKLLTNIFFFMIIGALLAMTPCSLPLIAILACIIVGESSDSVKISRTKLFTYILTYVITSSLVYGLIGYLAASFGIFLQLYIQSSILIYIFTFILLFVGMLLLRGKEISILQPIQNKLIAISNLQKGGSYFGIILMAILSTLIISPCVTAPVIGILSYVGITGDVTMGFIGLFFLGIGMGIPLLIFGLFAKSIFPKFPTITNALHIALGLMLFFTAFALIDPLLSDRTSTIVSGILIIFTAINLGVLKKTKPTLFANIWKTITITLFIYGAALLLPTFMTDKDLNPHTKIQIPENSSLKPPPFEPITNYNELVNSLKEAKKTNRVILVDFYAEWCISCIKMDANAWSNPEVQSLLHHFILLRVDLTNANVDSIELAKTLNVAGPPDALFFSKDGKQMNIRIAGTANASELIKYLKSVLKAAGIDVMMPNKSSPVNLLQDKEKNNQPERSHINSNKI